MKLFYAITLFILLSGCKPAPPIKPVKPPSLDPQINIQECPPKTSSLVDNVCGGLFTQEGLACVRCYGGEGCYNKPEIVYCVVGTCIADKRCRYFPPDVPVR